MDELQPNREVGEAASEEAGTSGDAAATRGRRRKRARKRPAPDEAAGVVDGPAQEGPTPDGATDEGPAELAAGQSGEEQDSAQEQGPVQEQDADGVDATEREDDETPTRRGPGADLPPEELRRRVSALLFASPDPLSVGRLVKLLDGPEPKMVRKAIEEIGQRLEAADVSLQLRGLAGGFAYFTTPDVASIVARLSKVQSVERVSPAALETLAVVAYRQPVTKAEIEAIRGVQAGPVLRSLVDRGLVRVVGRADVPGHPLQYGTTKEFLDRFGLMSVKELPRDGELARG